MPSRPPPRTAPRIAHPDVAAALGRHLSAWADLDDEARDERVLEVVEEMNTLGYAVLPADATGGDPVELPDSLTPSLLSLSQVARLWGTTRNNINKLPMPVPDGFVGGAAGWRASKVIAWRQDTSRKPGVKPGSKRTPR